jgi:hypothetical protein
MRANFDDLPPAPLVVRWSVLRAAAGWVLSAACAISCSRQMVFADLGVGGKDGGDLATSSGGAPNGIETTGTSGTAITSGTAAATTTTTTGIGGLGGIGGFAGGGGNDGPTDGGGADCSDPCICMSGVRLMDGYLNRDDCATALLGFTCAPGACVPNQPNPLREQHWLLDGLCITNDQPYVVGLHIYGVVECKAYAGNFTRANPTESADPSGAHNLWIEGGSDVHNRWTTYALTVTASPSTVVPGRDMAPDGPVYFLNQCPPGEMPNVTTWKIDYTVNLVVPGGSFINFLEFDDDCNMNANCGDRPVLAQCVNRHVVEIPASASPPPPSSFVQPIENSLGAPGQWWFVDVTSINPL